MDTKWFFILVALCTATHIVRSVYEVLKSTERIKPDKTSFVIIFTNMMLLWMSWFALCSLDSYSIYLPGLVRYSGFCLVGIGMILFLVALFRMKTLESYEGDLITTGIYSKIRHPMYLGFILWLVGFPVFQGALFSFFLSFLFIANVLFWRYLEEKELEERFSDYADYKMTTWF